MECTINSHNIFQCIININFNEQKNTENVGMFDFRF